MTIIQPNKYQDVRRLALILGSVTIATIAVVVFSYIETVNLRHELSRGNESLEEMKVQNAELKNKFYNLVDNNNLEQLAAEKGFVEDRNPEWALESHF
ncbi:MAG: hypothetical protein HYS89_02255 [Candidatus Colwellbacteria bacterium]|nr:hypothetical protein [Candidatus Colwellbacteria bacterium]